MNISQTAYCTGTKFSAVVAWVKDHIAENFFCYVLNGSPQGRKFTNFEGRSYLEIGKSVCCKMLSAGSHMTGNEYLRTKLGHLQKLRTREIFLNLNFTI